MEYLVDKLRDILGVPDFYIEGSSSYSSNYWDYGAMLEYAIAGILLCIVVSSVFKFIRILIK